nr:hypothetical protein [Tanacetum cinerariifolium]
VPEIYMQEFWATAKLHHNSIRFKMDTKKSVLDLEAFKEMLHISPRIPSQSFAELPSEEEILEFLRRNRINWHYVRDDVLFSTIKVAAPKPKVSARKKKGDSTSSTTPPTLTPTTTVVSAPRLSATAKDEGTGSRPGVPDVPSDDSEEELSWNSFDDEEGDEQTKGREESEGDKTDESNDGNDDNDDETVKAGSESDKDDDDNDDEEEPAKNDDEDTESGKGGDEPRRPPSPDRDWNKTMPAAQGDAQSWISDLARQTDARSSFNEL